MSLTTRIKAASSQIFRRSNPDRHPLDFAGPKLLRAFAESVPDPFFIEIGSNDGDQHDHLRPFILERGWSGIMVEPVDYVFRRLAAELRGLR